MRLILLCCALAAALPWMPASAGAQAASPVAATGSSAGGAFDASRSVQGMTQAKPATPGDLFAEGYLHLTGKGTARDATRAAGFFLEAAQAGEPQAQYQLGVLFMEGLGVPRDLLWAWHWLDRAVSHPGLPGEVRDQARGRLAALSPMLNQDQKRRLGLK